MEEIQKQSEFDNILDTPIVGGKKIRELTAFQFCQFVLQRLNNVKVDNMEIVKLTKLVNNWNTQFPMTDDLRVDTMLRLQNLNLWKPKDN